MEPRQEELKKVQEHRQPEEKPGRFQITKLEERIAPASCHLSPQGKFVGRCGFSIGA